MKGRIKLLQYHAADFLVILKNNIHYLFKLNFFAMSEFL